jgi:hypothetical protein
MQTRLPIQIGSMGLFDKLFARPTIDRFAAELIQALQEAGETDELRHDAPERRILADPRWRGRRDDREMTIVLPGLASSAGSPGF